MRKVGVLAIGVVLVGAGPALVQSSVSDDIAAPLRAAQAAKQPPAPDADDQFKQVFRNWRSLEKTNIPALRAVAEAANQPAEPITYYGTFGTWPVGRFKDGCAMSDGFEGPGGTILTFVKYEDGGTQVVIKNSNWSAQKDREYPIRIQIDGHFYSGNSGGRQEGFAIGVPAEFERDFASGKFIAFFLRDQLIDKLSLKGTAAGVGGLNRCIAAIRAALAAEQREKERWKHLPKDPFAPGH